MRVLSCLLFSATLAACATEEISPRAQPVALFNDALFSAPSEKINARDALALSPEMREFLSSTIAQRSKTEGQLAALVQALNDKKQLSLEYDASMTRTAAQAFSSHTGNCLSLALMAGAMAKELNLAIHYQQVSVDETWSRNSGLYATSGHINLVIGRRMQDVSKSVFHDTNAVVIDFSPLMTEAAVSTREVSEHRVIAMFLNNRAVEALSQGKLDDAYWWARTSIVEDVSFLPAYNTLGVVYERHGDLKPADTTFRSVLDSSANNTITLANEIQVLKRMGLTGEAKLMDMKLSKLQPVAPYQYFNLGITAMDKGDFKAAKEYFDKEISRVPESHEFHFWLAQAHFRLGEMRDAFSELSLAKEYSITRRDQDLYSAKLEKMKAYGL